MKGKKIDICPLKNEFLYINWKEKEKKNKKQSKEQELSWECR